MRSDLIDLQLYIRYETAGAVLVDEGVPAADGEKIWLPKSAIEIERESSVAKIATITMPEQLAKEKGLV